MHLATHLPFLVSFLTRLFAFDVDTEKHKPEEGLPLKICFSHHVLLLMVILLAPFLPWQQTQ